MLQKRSLQMLLSLLLPCAFDDDDDDDDMCSELVPLFAAAKTATAQNKIIVFGYFVF